jgi:hypothetical protein
VLGKLLFLRDVALIFPSRFAIRTREEPLRQAKDKTNLYGRISHEDQQKRPDTHGGLGLFR